MRSSSSAVCVSHLASLVLLGSAVAQGQTEWLWSRDVDRTAGKAVYDIVGPYLGTTLEQFEINLMRDADPDSEVAVWCGITAAWLAYHEKYTGDEMLPDEEEKKLLAALIVISTGVTDVNTFGVPADVGRRLLECYDGLAGGG